MPFAPAPGLNALSTVPSVFSRRMRLIEFVLKTVKAPPAMILESSWMATAWTVLFAPVPMAKVVSTAPRAVRRARRLRLTLL